MSFLRLGVALITLVISEVSLGQSFSRADNDSHWDSRYQFMGFDWGVDDFTFLHDTIVAFGGFHTAGGHRAPGIAYYDGSSWFRMGIPDDDSTYITHVQPMGRYLFASGKFGTIDGRPLQNLARWDWLTHTWSNPGLGIHGIDTGRGFELKINALCAIGDDLYVAGMFDSAGPIAAKNIARYNVREDRWYPLGAGLSGNSWPVVDCLATDTVSVWVGGRFDAAGGVPATGFARWKPENHTWDNMGFDGGSGSYSEILSIVLFRDTVIVWGHFDSCNGIPADGMARWFGLWQPMPQPVPGPVISLSCDIVNGQLIESGSAVGVDQGISSFEKWTGSERIPIQGRTIPYVIHTHDGILFASGSILDSIGVEHALGYLQDSDTTWVGLDSLSGVSTQVIEYSMVTLENKLYAYDFFGGFFRRLDNDGWTTLDGGRPILDRNLFTDRTNLFSLTYDELFFPGRESPVPLILQVYHPENNYWEVLDTVGQYPGPIAPVVHNGVIYLGGKFDSINGHTFGNVVAFNVADRTWKSLGNGIPCSKGASGVHALAFFNGDLIAAGDFDTSHSNVMRYVASRNEWENLGDTLIADNVLALAASDRLLYMGSQLSVVRSIDTQTVSQWDGTSWKTFAPVVRIDASNRGPLHFAMQNDTDLIVAGNWASIGSLQTRRLARWDGHEWHPLGSGVNGAVSSMVVNGQDIYVSGDFSTAGDLADRYFAHWTDAISSPPIRYKQTITATVYPNPVEGELTLGIHTSIATQLQVALYNAAGVRMAVLYDGFVEAGQIDLTHNMIDLCPSNGAYIIQIRGGITSVAVPVAFDR